MEATFRSTIGMRATSVVNFPKASKKGDYKDIRRTTATDLSKSSHLAEGKERHWRRI